MPPRKISDLATAFLVVGLGLFVYVQALAMPAAKRGLGPGGYPKFIALGLVLLGAALAGRFFLEGKAPASVSGPPEGRAGPGRNRTKRVLFFMALCFAYSQAIHPLGFVLSSVVFLAVAIRFFGYRRPVVGAVVSLGLPIALYLLFRNIFLVLIPLGSLFR